MSPEPKTPTRFEKTIHGGSCGTAPFFIYKWQPPPEYGRGDCVLVWYDDLCDLAQKVASRTPGDQP